jgi:hypothetical protein
MKFQRKLVSRILIVVSLVLFSLFGLKFYRSQLITALPFWDSPKFFASIDEIGKMKGLKDQVFDRLTKTEGVHSIVWADNTKSELLLDFADSFTNLVKQNFPSRASEKTRIYFLADQNQYNLVYSDLLGLQTGYEWGWFSNAEPLIMLNESRGIGILGRYLGIRAYEAYVQQGGVRLPYWFETGFYSYLEKFVAHKDEQGHMVIELGFLNQGRFPVVLENRHKPLSDFLDNPTQDGGSHVLGTFIVFLNREGWLEPFIKASVAKDSGPLDALEKVSKLKIAAIDLKFKKWISTTPKSDIDLVPGSMVLSFTEYINWKKKNNLITER